MGYFSGTASFYSEFRSGYPDEVWDALTVAAEVDRSSRVLDLGAGPATATVELAGRAGFVVAVDGEAEMVREGRRVTDEAGLGNVGWVNADADRIAFPPGSFQLIVIASAFHWMNRPVVAARCRSMLAEGGLLAIVGNPTPLMQVREGTAIGSAIRRVQVRWFGDHYHVLDTDELDRPEVVLQECGFSSVTVSHVAQTQHWNVERFLGFLRSTSSRPDQRLGDRYSAFAADIDHAIRTVEPSGRWTLEVPVEVIIGRT